MFEFKDEEHVIDHLRTLAQFFFLLVFIMYTLFESVAITCIVVEVSIWFFQTGDKQRYIFDKYDGQPRYIHKAAKAGVDGF